MGRLLSAGFSIGSTVALKSHEGKVWVVHEAPGDNVELREAGVSNKEPSLVLTASGFLKSATHSQAGNTLVKHPSWPAKRASVTSAAAEAFARGRVWSALEALVRRVGLGVERQVDLYTKPRKLVKAKTILRQGRLLLVPEASGLKVLGPDTLSPDAPAPAGLWEVVLENPPAGFDSRIFLAGGGADSVSAFWSVEIVDKEEEANMEVLWYQVSSLCGADPVSDDPRGVPVSSGPAASVETQPGAFTEVFSKASGGGQVPTMVFSKASGSAFSKAAPTPRAAPPKASAPPASGNPTERKRLASLALAGASDEPFDRKVFIPVFVNKVALAEGAEIKVLGSTEKAPQKMPKAISVVQLAKRAKA